MLFKLFVLGLVMAFQSALPFAGERGYIRTVIVHIPVWMVLGVTIGPLLIPTG
jgi:hypothetical protein